MVWASDLHPPFAGAGAEQVWAGISEECPQPVRASFASAAQGCGVEGIWRRQAQALGRGLLGTFLTWSRKVPRLAGRDPPVSLVSQRTVSVHFENLQNPANAPRREATLLKLAKKGCENWGRLSGGCNEEDGLNINPAGEGSGRVG